MTSPSDLTLICELAAHSLPTMSVAQKVAFYEALSRIHPQAEVREKAEYTAYTISKADAAQEEMAAILHQL